MISPSFFKSKLTKKSINKPNGFTLIELIIAISVIAILSLIGIASFINNGKNSTMQSAVNELTAYLIEAKSSALSQTLLSSHSCDQLTGYWVYIQNNDNSNTVELVEECNNGDNSVKHYALPQTLSFQNNCSIFFPVLSTGGKINLDGCNDTGPDSNGVIGIKDNSGGNIRNISITDSGAINDSDSDDCN